MAKTLTCRVVTPEGLKLDERATAIRLPAFDGQLGILPDHASMVTLLGQGALRLKTPDNKDFFLPIRGGIAEINNNVIMVLADRTGELRERSAEAQRRRLEQARRELLERREEPF